MEHLVIDHRRLKFGETVLVADEALSQRFFGVEPGVADVAGTEDLVAKFIGIGGAASPFTGSHELGKLEREAPDFADAAHSFAVLGGTMGMGAVFHHGDTVFLGDSCNGIHIGNR